jgi:hypothetical protein
MSLTSRTSFLLFLSSIGKLNLAALDALIPHGPVISVGARDAMASMIIKSIAREVKGAKLTQELNGLGKKLFTAGAKAMSYNDDDWCGTPPHRFGPDPIP